MHTQNQVKLVELKYNNIQVYHLFPSLPIIKHKIKNVYVI